MDDQSRKIERNALGDIKSRPQIAWRLKWGIAILLIVQLLSGSVSLIQAKGQNIPGISGTSIGERFMLERCTSTSFRIDL